MSLYKHCHGSRDVQVAQRRDRVSTRHDPQTVTSGSRCEVHSRHSRPFPTFRVRVLSCCCGLPGLARRRPRADGRDELPGGRDPRLAVGVRCAVHPRAERVTCNAGCQSDVSLSVWPVPCQRRWHALHCSSCGCARRLQDESALAVGPPRWQCNSHTDL